MNISIFSFFSGLGILDLGFEDAGFEIDFINECNPRFIEAYRFARKNKSHPPKYGYSEIDIRQLLKNDVWDNIFSDLKRNENSIVGFIGGPPCPDFSVAGKNFGKDGENGKLTEIYGQLIEKRRPDFFVLENVKGLYKTKKHRKFYEGLKLRLAGSGYKLFDSIENALEYGVPQYRDRLFLVGFFKESFDPEVVCKIGSHKKYSLKEIRLMNWPKLSPFIPEGDIKCPNGVLEDITVEYWFNKNRVELHPNGGDLFKVKAIEKYKTIPEGKTSGKSFKRLHRWKYAPTAAYGHNEVHLHPYKLRRLSVAEALAIQSVPQDFVLPRNIPLSDKFKMIGNGVPFLLALGVAKDVLDSINKYSKKR